MRKIILAVVIIVIMLMVGLEIYLLSSSIAAIVEKLNIPLGGFFYSVGGIFLVFVIILYVLKKLRS